MTSTTTEPRTYCVLSASRAESGELIVFAHNSVRGMADIYAPGAKSNPLHVQSRVDDLRQMVFGRAGAVVTEIPA